MIFHSLLRSSLCLVLCFSLIIQTYPPLAQAQEAQINFTGPIPQLLSEDDQVYFLWHGKRYGLTRENDLLVVKKGQDTQDLPWEFIPFLQTLDLILRGSNLRLGDIKEKLITFYGSQITIKEIHYIILMASQWCDHSSLLKEFVELPELESEAQWKAMALYSLGLKEKDPYLQLKLIRESMRYSNGQKELIRAGQIYALMVAQKFIGYYEKKLADSGIWNRLSMNAVRDSDKDSYYVPSLRELLGNTIHWLTVVGDHYLLDSKYLDSLHKDWEAQLNKVVDLKISIKLIRRKLESSDLILEEVLEKDLTGELLERFSSTLNDFRETSFFEEVSRWGMYGMDSNSDEEVIWPTLESLGLVFEHEVLKTETRFIPDVSLNRDFSKVGWLDWGVEQLNIYNALLLFLGPIVLGRLMGAAAKNPAAAKVLERFGLLEYALKLGNGQPFPLLPTREALGCWIFMYIVKETFDGHEIIALRELYRWLHGDRAQVEEFRERVQLVHQNR